MVPQAQVLVESFRTGAMEKFGLGPDVLHAINPKLVIVRISGWGLTGPYADKAGFGTLVEAFSGFAEKNGFSDKPPALPNLGLADMIAGLSGSFATMVALREVEVNGGKGQVVDLSLLEPIISILGPDAAIYQHTGEIPKRLGTAPRMPRPAMRIFVPMASGWSCQAPHSEWLNAYCVRWAAKSWYMTIVLQQIRPVWPTSTRWI